MENKVFLPPKICLKLRDEGYKQGVSSFLWYKNKHNRDKWELYERNKYDISCFGDSHGYKRWVSAVSFKDGGYKAVKESHYDTLKVKADLYDNSVKIMTCLVRVMKSQPSPNLFKDTLSLDIAEGFLSKVKNLDK